MHVASLTPPKKFRSRALLLAPLLITLFGGCGLVDQIGKTTDKVEDIAGSTVATLNNAIDAL